MFTVLPLRGGPISHYVQLQTTTFPYVQRLSASSSACAAARETRAVAVRFFGSQKEIAPVEEFGASGYPHCVLCFAQ